VARKKKCKVFISYSRHDEALVKPLAAFLGPAADDAVFLDITSIKAGAVWAAEIEDAIRDARVFYLCWCCEAEKSRFVAHEIETALVSGEKRMVPVLFCSARLPSILTDRQWIDLRGRVVHACNNHRGENPEPVSFTDQGGPGAVRRSKPKSAPRKRQIIGTAIVLAALICVQTYRTHLVPQEPAKEYRFGFDLILMSILFLAAWLLEWASGAVYKGFQDWRADRIAARAESYFKGLANR
jgi:hypothetical protein